jgi:hypothetical protein
MHRESIQRYRNLSFRVISIASTNVLGSKDTSMLSFRRGRDSFVVVAICASPQQWLRVI